MTAGLINGFGALAPAPFGYYAPVAVLAVCTGTYGGSIGLGRQRLLGSVVGAMVLLAAYAGLSPLPLPLGLSLSLVGMRLLGSALGLEVGYKVGSNIIVMGWLVHDSDLEPWVPLRLFWTVAGILVALLSLRLFWPDLAVDGNRRRLRHLFTDLSASLLAQADTIEAPSSMNPSGSQGVALPDRGERVQGLRRQLVTLRQAMAEVADELGNNPSSHPTYRLFLLLNRAGSQLIGVVDGLQLLTHSRSDRGALGDIHAAEAELLRAVAGRLVEWGACLEAPHLHRPSPPATVLEPPTRWQAVERWLHDPDLDAFDLDQLQRNASRLLLCGQALRSIEQAEQRWQALAAPAAA